MVPSASMRSGGPLVAWRRARASRSISRQGSFARAPRREATDRGGACRPSQRAVGQGTPRGRRSCSAHRSVLASCRSRLNSMYATHEKRTVKSGRISLDEGVSGVFVFGGVLGFALASRQCAMFARKCRGVAHNDRVRGEVEPGTQSESSSVVTCNTQKQVTSSSGRRVGGDPLCSRCGRAVRGSRV
jgi:hypothetical protein